MDMENFLTIIDYIVYIWSIIMKQQEKTQKTIERIISSAVEEFGSKNYDAASINSICEKGHISKGLLYHNFKSKDELYLKCVKICYDEMTLFLKSQSFEVIDAKESLQKFFLVRQKFFYENPLYANIFFNAVLSPPKHLVQELLALRKDFDEYFSKFYLRILKCLALREGITEDMALEYFSIICEMFNEYFKKRADQEGDYRMLIDDHEDKMSKIFDIIFYGIAKEDKGDK